MRWVSCIPLEMDVPFQEGGRKLDPFSFVGDVLSPLGYQLNLALSVGSRNSIHSHEDVHSFERASVV